MAAKPYVWREKARTEAEVQARVAAARRAVVLGIVRRQLARLYAAGAGGVVDSRLLDDAQDIIMAAFDGPPDGA